MCLIFMASDLAIRRSDISGTRDDTLFITLNPHLLDFYSVRTKERFGA